MIKPITYNIFTDHDEFMESLQNPQTLYDLMVSIETMLHNGEYIYENSMTLFTNIFPTVKTPRGLKMRILRRYKDPDLAQKLYQLLITYETICRQFLQDLDYIVYDYI